MNKKINILASVLLAGLFLLIVYKSTGIWFETNDDVFIQELLSGKLTGQNEFRCPYVSILITYPISLLFRVFPGIGWWGIFLLFAMFLVVFFSLLVVTLNANNIFQLAGGIAFFMCALVAGLHNFGQAQYTSTAMLLAVTGYLVLIGIKNTKSAVPIFILCELLSCAIRSSSMMIVQPLGFATYFGILLANSSNSQKNRLMKSFNKIISIGLCVISIILVFTIVSKVTFLPNEWNDYKKFDDTRIQLIDYETKIPYSSIEATLSKYDVSSEDYNQLLNQRIWYSDNHFTSTCIEELKPEVKAIRKETEKNPQFLPGILTVLYGSKEFWHLHQIVLLFFATVFIAIAICKSWKMLYAWSGTLIGYLCGLIALAYRNRFVFRVMMPYYHGTILLLVVTMLLLLYENVKTGSRLIRSLSLIALSLLIAFTALFSARQQFSYIRRQNNVVNATEYESAKELQYYCNTHPENHYILDLSYLRNISTNIVEGTYYQKANYIYSGSWYETAPSMVNKANDYLSEGNLYFPVYETQEFLGYDGMEYYASKIKNEPELFDKFRLSTGATIWVYKLR